MSPTFPSICKDCTDRAVGCHSVCEKYKAAKEAYDAEVERVRQEHFGEIDAYNCAKSGTLRVMKQNHDRRVRK
jgi:hypothetical protein